MIDLYPVASLLLDEANPRFVRPVNSQREAVNAILADGAAKLINLAEDIALQDAVNPTELPVLVSEDGELIVIEGNRRVAALKLLRKPDLADDTALESRFKSISKHGQGPEEIYCFLADSRDAAKHWLDLRHTGENAGVGVVGWEAWQSNNFRRRPGTQADRATLFCVAVLKDFPDETDLTTDIETVQRERLTTLGRLVADPDVRRDFGFDFEDDAVIFYYRRENLLYGFSKIFADLAGDLGVSQIKSKEQRQEYIRESADVLPPRSERLAQSRRPGEVPPAPPPIDPSGVGTTSGTGSGSAGGGSQADPTAGQGASPPPNTSPSQSNAPAPGASTNPPPPDDRSKRRMPPPERTIFQGLRLRGVGIRTSRLLQQAQTVNIDSAPAVAAVMLRVVVELAVTDATRQPGWPASEKDTLKKKIAAALLALDPDASNPIRRDKQLEPAWTRSQDESGMAVQAMHSFVHNVFANPMASEVRELSSTFRALLERLDQYLAARRSS